MLCNKSDQGGKTYTVKTITHCLKEMKEYTSKWRDIHVHKTGKLNIVQMSIQLKAIYRLNLILIKTPKVIFFRNTKIFPKMHTESEGAQNSQSF